MFANVNCINTLILFLWWVHDKSLQSCPTLCKPKDCSPPSSSVHGILQARTLEWIALSSSRGSFLPRDRTQVSCSSSIAGGFFTAEPPWRWPQIAPGKNSTKVQALVWIHCKNLVRAWLYFYESLTLNWDCDQAWFQRCSYRSITQVRQSLNRI